MKVTHQNDEFSVFDQLGKVDEEIREAKDEINKHGFITLDAAIEIKDAIQSLQTILNNTILAQSSVSESVIDGIWLDKMFGKY